MGVTTVTPCTNFLWSHGRQCILSYPMTLVLVIWFALVSKKLVTGQNRGLDVMILMNFLHLVLLLLWKHTPGSQYSFHLSFKAKHSQTRFRAWHFPSQLADLQSENPPANWEKESKIWISTTLASQSQKSRVVYWDLIYII